MRALAVRRRLTAAFAAVMAVVLTATGLFVYKRQATNLDGAINRALRARATDIAALAQRSDTGLSDGRPSESPGAQVGLRQGIAQLKRIPGVRSVEPLQHRFAYIGEDLQDLYGVRPQTITGQGKFQNGWFAGGTAAGLMKILATQPDAILVSAETVHDYQLHPGGTIRLRLQNGETKQLTTTPFRCGAVAKDFPTAPKDSFLVANQSHIAARTGSDAVGSFLVQIDATGPVIVHRRIARTPGSNAQVTDIVNQRRVMGSSLTAVELSGLSRIELGFALVLAAAASGLALGLGSQERRRTFAFASALGARTRQLGGFVWGESIFVTPGASSSAESPRPRSRSSSSMF